MPNSFGKTPGTLTKIIKSLNIFNKLLASGRIQLPASEAGSPADHQKCQIHFQRQGLFLSGGDCFETEASGFRPDFWFSAVWSTGFFSEPKTLPWIGRVSLSQNSPF